MSEPCPNCNGYGEVTAGDPDIGQPEYPIQCARCEGTGFVRSSASVEARAGEGPLASNPTRHALVMREGNPPLERAFVSGSSAPPAQNLSVPADAEESYCEWLDAEARRHSGEATEDDLSNEQEYAECNQLQNKRDAEEREWARQLQLQQETDGR